MAVTYHCPSCGAVMIYKAESGSITCEHCGRSMSAEEVQGSQDGQSIPEGRSGSENREHRRAEFRQYHCSSCGAEILTDSNTIASLCSFCGSPSLIKDRMVDELQPAKIIPFKITKEQAIEIYHKWTRSHPLISDVFKQKGVLEEIRGVYVPYWLYDFDTEVDMAAACTRTRYTRRGDVETTYTDHYDVRRSISVSYEKVPVEAAKKMDDTMMSYLEPFDYKDLVNFQMPYLSGFLAEKYNYASDEKVGEAKRRVNEYALSTCRGTIGGYSSVVVTSKNANIRETKSEYVLLPVWLLVFRNGNKESTFAVNGQTGRRYGRLPLSGRKMAVLFAGSTAVCFLILTVLTLVRGI